MKGNDKVSKAGTAAVFPGQGTQRKGMGEDFFNAFPECRAVYEEASDTLGWDVADMCFQDDRRIDLTEYAQPSIFTTETAMLRSLQKIWGFSAGYFGGHSVGEYAALVAAGAMPFREALKVVQARGRLMQACFPEGAGGMVAVIGDNLKANLIRRAIAGLPVDVANINSASQVVISGRSGALKKAGPLILQSVGDPRSIRFVRLNVSAPFHSRFMAGIEHPFRACLEAVKEKIHASRAEKVTSNYTGDFYPAARQAVVDNLLYQISGTVQWHQNMARLREKAEVVFEIGPQRPLKQFFSSLSVECRSITTLAAAERVFGAASKRNDHYASLYV